MDYRKFGETYYIRMDRGDEIVQTILDICEKEQIKSAFFTGIGGCSDVEMQVFIPERGEFETERVEGTLELVNITGDLMSDENGKLYHHTHALYTYIENGEHKSVSGHLKSSMVLYTAEIELRPVLGGVIGRKYDPVTGTGFWKF